MKNKEFLEKLNMKEMISTQINSWELMLKKKGLKDKTIERKLNNLIYFYMHLTALRKDKERIKIDNISNIAFEYVRDGYFSEDNIDNEGCYGYRRNIYCNLREGFNFIYQGYFKNKIEVINDLIEEQKEVLEDVSKNKWFNVVGIKDDRETIQTKIIEELGLKVYFDKENNPYVLSHETAELIGKKHKDVTKAIRLILDRFTRAKKIALVENVDISMIEDHYTYNTNNGGTKDVITYRLSKDLVINYILGMSGDKYFDFKIKYQSAFNYIEREYKKLLEEHSTLKDSFLKMYNNIRKRNRDLLIKEHNKKAKSK
ncbi:TPA: Rha family transcriptional regulator [Clostridium botulinum]|uniref:Rha family transcriptional regulator n=1 Tax=Clostridium botulinum TaxID=1491 RepID=UPI0004B41C05|nr:Rha family transcriptional regulator [Clostridium botulinum]APH20869.1 phage regulatory Rha family protein [Clostridium botulinum]APQ71182.1 phage regulatory Rha family protein [Clostridium botulinum]APR02314.1 phage regulatory Rha family protein [Clostridium botulinum]